MRSVLLQHWIPCRKADVTNYNIATLLNTQEVTHVRGVLIRLLQSLWYNCHPLCCWAPMPNITLDAKHTRPAGKPFRIPWLAALDAMDQHRAKSWIRLSLASSQLFISQMHTPWTSIRGRQVGLPTGPKANQERLQPARLALIRDMTAEPNNSGSIFFFLSLSGRY